MQRGSIVRNNKGEYFIFLSNTDGIANCAVVEDVMDSFQLESVAKVTSLRKIPVLELIVTDEYPLFFNQISIS